MSPIATVVQEFRQAIHVLNGDMLLGQLQALEPQAEYIVMRECLVEGAVSNTSVEQFYKLRSSELQSRYGLASGEYERKTVQELVRISAIPADREVMLWFENDLFCQTNLWFLSTLFNPDNGQRLSRVYPSAARSGWNSFSLQSHEELIACVTSRQAYTTEDLQTSQACWTAYCADNTHLLREIAITNNPLFQHCDVLAELIEYRQCQDIRGSKLASKIKELASFQSRTFSLVFAEFQRLYPMYGFGDLQLKSIFNQLVS